MLCTPDFHADRFWALYFGIIGSRNPSKRRESNLNSELHGSEFPRTLLTVNTASEDFETRAIFRGNETIDDLFAGSEKADRELVLEKVAIDLCKSSSDHHKLFILITRSNDLLSEISVGHVPQERMNAVHGDNPGWFHFPEANYIHLGSSVRDCYIGVRGYSKSCDGVRIDFCVGKRIGKRIGLKKLKIIGIEVIDHIEEVIESTCSTFLATNDIRHERTCGI